MNYPTLQLDDHYFPNVLNGIITATIRIGDRPITPGNLLFIATNANYLPLLVTVDRVIHTTWLGISDHDARLAGYPDADVARDVLLTTYPEAKPDTPFTIIRFSRPV